MVFTKTIPFSKEVFNLIYTSNVDDEGLSIDKYNNKPFNIDFVYAYVYDISMSYDEDMNSLTISSSLMNIEETPIVLMVIDDKGLPKFMINKRSGTICEFNFSLEYRKNCVLNELRSKFGVEKPVERFDVVALHDYFTDESDED